MDHNSSRIAKNTIFLYLRMIITMLVSLYTVRVILNVLGAEEYGIFSAVGGFVSTMSIVTSVLANASQRFFSIEIGLKHTARLRKVFGTVVVTYIIVTIALVILFESVGGWFLTHKMSIPEGRMNAALWVFHFSVASFALTFLFSPFQSLIIAHEHLNFYALLSILEVVIKLSIVYLLLVVSYDKLKVYAVLQFLSFVLISVSYYGYCKYHFSEVSTRIHLDCGIFKEVFSFSFWTMFGSGAYVLNTQGVNILLNLFFGPMANAAYAIGSQVSNAVNSLGTNFFTAFRPPIIKAFSSEDYPYLVKLYYLSSKIIFLFLFVFVLPLCIETHAILHLWLGETSLYMESFVRLMLLYILVLSMNLPITSIAQASGRVKEYHGIVDGFTLLGLPVIYLAFKLGVKAEIAFIIEIVFFIVAHFIRLLIIKSILPVLSITSYIRKIIIPILMVVMISSTVTYILHDIISGSLLGSLSVCVCSVICTALVSFLIVFSREERNYLINFIGHRKKK